ncbi:hypothetical protein JW898_05320 [Candidatus Woesearchaeota archaeon]|nr:hypothetical protein [Candidatus Woesearchaeota archaeon]
MKWVRHYKKRSSAGHHIIKRIGRREDMARKKTGTAAGSAGKLKAAKAAKGSVTDIPPEKYFILRSGTPIKSIEELALMLDSISDEDFSFHVNVQKNDFSNWLKDVFGRADLADMLGPVKDRKESQIVLLKHMVYKGR